MKTFQPIVLPLFAAMVSALAWTSQNGFAQSVLVVDWAGPNQKAVTSSQNLSMPSAQSADGGLTNIYAWSDTVSIEPSSGYNPPPGKSIEFYGGSYLTSDTGSANTWQQARIFHWNDTFDRLEFDVSNVPDGTEVGGAVFVGFLQNGFLKGTDNATVTFDETSSMSMAVRVVNDNPSTFRFAALDDGQWYLSETSVSSNTTLTIDSSEILSSNWGLWSPTGGSDGRLGGVPGTFDVQASSFTNLQGFGWYADLPPGDGERIFAGITGFHVMAVPEPGAVVLALLGAGLLWGRRRRKG